MQTFEVYFQDGMKCYFVQVDAENADMAGSLALQGQSMYAVVLGVWPIR